MESIRNTSGPTATAGVPTGPHPRTHHSSGGHPSGQTPAPSTPQMGFNPQRTNANSSAMSSSSNNAGPFPDVVPTHRLTFDVSAKKLTKRKFITTNEPKRQFNQEALLIVKFSNKALFSASVIESDYKHFACENFF